MRKLALLVSGLLMVVALSFVVATINTKNDVNELVNETSFNDHRMDNGTNNESTDELLNVDELFFISQHIEEVGLSLLDNFTVINVNKTKNGDDFNNSTIFNKDCSSIKKWRNAFELALQDDLWNSRDAYDACMGLMVPLHYCFQTEDVAGIELFTNEFQRFCNTLSSDLSPNNSDYYECGTLYKLHWLYFCSQYMKLMCSNNLRDCIPDSLYQFVDVESVQIWDTYQGAYKAEFNGMDDLLQSILDGDGYSINKSYKNAISDLEWFVLSIMCDMAVLDDYFEGENNTLHKNAASWASKMMEKKVTPQDDGGWLFGVGDLTDHQDYQYAGNERIVEGIKPKIVLNAVDDSSHFSRTPFFLISMRDAQTDYKRLEFFNELREGLAIQFTEHVLFFPDKDIPYVRITNYMDGWNGVYRYGYHEKGVGYDSWELSAALLNGWWAGLNDSIVSAAYSEMLSSAPFSASTVAFYTPHVSVRERNSHLIDMDIVYYRLYCAANLLLE